MANPLALVMGRGYSSPVLAKSRASFSRLKRQRRASANTGAFLLPVIYGGCAWEAFGLAGCLCRRSANPRTVATQTRLAAGSGGSKDKGAAPMRNTARKPSDHAAAWRALAMAALHADSSLAVRLARYNAAMARARQLDTQEASA